MILAVCDAYSRGCPSIPPTLPPEVPDTPTIPITGFTGGDLILWVLAGISLIVLGLTIYYTARRR